VALRQLMVCVSGLLSKHEGDMHLLRQPLQLSTCWSAAAAFFESADWWHLGWGSVELEALASKLRATGPITTLPQALSVRAQWSSCYDAAKSAGARLAELLRSRRCGHRAVSLLAVSLGARVVWHCLELLSELPNREGRGLVQDVVFVVAPVTANPARWDRAASVVAGRLINAYVPGDEQLSLLYRSDHFASQGCCGSCAVASSRVENLDATAHVAQASECYHFSVPGILAWAGLLEGELQESWT
jgi:hypothetical protein